jgi:hypothetical protein
MHTNKRFSRLADLLGQLEQAYLDRDFPMAGVQVPDLIPRSGQRSLRMRETTSGRSPMGSRTFAWNTML